MDTVWEALTTFEDNNPADNADSEPVALVVSVTRPVDKATAVEFVVDKPTDKVFTPVDKVTAVAFVVDKLLDKITAVEFVVDNPTDKVFTPVDKVTAVAFVVDKPLDNAVMDAV